MICVRGRGRAGTIIRITVSTLACLWIVGRVFIVMCRWSEADNSPSVSCSGIVDHMCAEYSRNRLSGSLCLELCHNISSDRFNCRHINEHGKKVVFFTHSNNEQLVLKAESFSSYALQVDGSLSHASQTNTLLYLRQLSKDLFTSNASFDRFIEHLDINSHNDMAVIASAESLLEQQEYLTFNNLQETGVVPTLHGTCGNYYAVDYVPTDAVLLSNTYSDGLPFRSIGLWEDRRMVAIRLLELAERLGDHDRHICDVSGSNFGSLENGVAAIIDADSVFTSQELGQQFRNISCWKDTDCYFGDCHGICNHRTNRCTSTISSTNFQIICSKLLNHHHSNAYHGLLADLPPKIKRSVKNSLSRCHWWKMSKRISNRALRNIRKLLIHDQILG